MDAVDRVLTEADRAWRAYGVGAADRATLAADLRLDLAEAAADGVDPRRLIGGDVPAFARRLADEAGLERTPPEYARLLGAGLLGAALTGAVDLVLLTAFSPLFVRTADVPVQLTVGVYYGIPAALVVAGIVLAVRLRLRDVPKIRATTRWMARLLPPAGIVITPITIGFAYATDYSTAPTVVLTEVALVLAALAGATVLARHLALREHPARPQPAGVPG